MRASARTVVNGAMVGPPVSKSGKAGKPYASATIREGGGEAKHWKAFCFNEAAIEEILRFVDGESIAVVGEFDAEIYAPAGGGARMSWRIRADVVLSARRPKAEKAARTTPTGNKRAVASSWAHPNAPGSVIEDPLPF
jgi:hypothetical protein